MHLRGASFKQAAAAAAEQGVAAEQISRAIIGNVAQRVPGGADDLEIQSQFGEADPVVFRKWMGQRRESAPVAGP